LTVVGVCCGAECGPFAHRQRVYFSSSHGVL